jgi:hypothetical protein
MLAADGSIPCALPGHGADATAASAANKNDLLIVGLNAMLRF